MKLIIDISELDYECAKQRWMMGNDAHKMDYYISKGIPLDSNSERAETQAYFAGEAYGWEQGRKALIDEVKAEIEKQIERDFAFAETETLKVPCHYGIANGLQNAIRFLENIGKESEEEPNE